MFNKNKHMSIKNHMRSDFVQYTLGKLDIIIISDGEVYENNFLAPGIPENILIQAFKEKGLEPPYYQLVHNIAIIKSEQKIIMIDTGNGYKKAPQAGKLLDNLALAGIAPRDITDIVLTHAHPDHTNGLIDRNNHMVFPSAKIHISKQEFEFWRNEADFSKSKSPKESLLSLQKDIQLFFSLVQNQLHLFQNNDTLFDCLQSIPAPGHTPGHCIFVIKSHNKRLIHLADVFHDETILFTQPEWGTIFDIDFDLAVSTRRKILEDFAETGQLLFGYHLPWPGLGYIQKEKEIFKWTTKENYNTD